MPKVPVFNMEGEQVGEIELNDAIFGAEVNEPLVHQVVVMQLANRRAGTHKVKTRGEVAGGGRKPWRQKGTGRARHGSIRSPIWRHGGTVFGPVPRDYGFSMPKQARRKALISALSAKVGAGELVVVDDLRLAEAKTRAMASVLEKLDAQRSALIVTAERDENVQRSSRNLPGVDSVVAQGLNVYDVVSHDKLVMTKSAVTKVEEVLG